MRSLLVTAEPKYCDRNAHNPAHSDGTAAGAAWGVGLVFGSAQADFPSSQLPDRGLAKQPEIGSQTDPHLPGQAKLSSVHQCRRSRAAKRSWRCLPAYATLGFHSPAKSSLSATSSSSAELLMARSVPTRRRNRALMPRPHRAMFNARNEVGKAQTYLNEWGP